MNIVLNSKNCLSMDPKKPNEKEEKHALRAVMNLDKTGSHEDFKYTNVRGK